MVLSLEQAISQVPFLKDAPDIQSTPLKGGITNTNYRIDAGGSSYMLRITGESTDLLGIRRQVEHQANLYAGRLGVAPEVLYFIEPEGYLVTRFIVGRHIPPAEIKQEYYLRQVARKLRLFHRNAPGLAGEFNVFRRVEMLAEISRQHACTFPFDFDWIMGKMREVEAALLEDPYVPTPCHCDLLNLNFLGETTPGDLVEIKILDWEYAGQGDIFFDLANFGHHHALNDDQVRLLLGEYFGEVTVKNFARLKLMWPMSEIHEAMWGTTQTGISSLDEDFQGYANLWFCRAREALTDYRYEQWLKDVASH
jgi:thiamine kinase-like enzyme